MWSDPGTVSDSALNWPNLITLSRLGVTAVCFGCLELAEPAAPDAVWIWVAFGLFIFAAATDFVDGWLARRLGQVTAFGRIADPFADKILVCGVLVMLLRFPSAQAYVPTWFVTLILAREFLVTTIRGWAESQGHAFPAEKLGKYKMVIQCVFASAVMTAVAGSALWLWVVEIAFWLTLALTVVSGVQYVMRAAALANGDGSR